MLLLTFPAAGVGDGAGAYSENRRRLEAEEEAASELEASPVGGNIVVFSFDFSVRRDVLSCKLRPAGGAGDW